AVRRTARKLLANFLRLLLESGVVDDFPNQTPALGLLGGNRLSKHGETPRARKTDKTGQYPCSARVRNKSDFREGLKKTGGPCGNHDIACQRDICSRSGRSAVNGTNRRKGKRAKA